VALPIVLVALLLVGALAVALAAIREREDNETADKEITELIRADLTATVDELVAALVGASAIVNDDGTIGNQRWVSFATAAVDASVLESLALEVAVSDSGRKAFEAEYYPILEPGPEGGFVAAQRRGSYLPVRSVVPITEESRQLQGFDIGADPLRLAATKEADARGSVVISAPLAARPTGQPAFFVVQPLFRPSSSNPRDESAEPAVGFITTAVSGQSVVDAALALLPDGTRFTIDDSGTRLGATEQSPRGGHTVSFSVAGREWQITGNDARGPSYGLAWLIGISTLILTVSIALVLRSRLQAQRQQARDANRHARSADLAQRLAEARTTVAVAEAVHAEVPPLLGARNASVRTVISEQNVLQTVIDEDLPDPLTTTVPIPIDDTTPPGHAVVERRWILIDDIADQADRYGKELTDILIAYDYRSFAFIPLEDSDGTVVGLLGVAWDKPRSFDDVTMALLRTVAELCEQTLERSRLHDSEHSLVQRLQSAALSPPSPVAGLQIAVRYQSAVQTLTMGGDWYDTVELDDRSIALVVGDVAGHGVPAIAEMIEIRSAIHALLRSRHRLEQVLEIADSILGSSNTARIATALVAVFDARRQVVRYISAGHPPAILRGPGATVEVLMDGRRPVIGVPPASPCTVAERPFVPGSTLVAFTDGLVERRDEDILASVDKLAAELSVSELHGDELADAILATYVPDDSSITDDVALVVVHAT
jgi:serine phosphatase RsbU (regulator of sigma subunit)/CHASE1-domain containing sensor protein